MTINKQKFIFIGLSLIFVGTLTHSFYNENAKVFAFLEEETECVVDPILETKFIKTERGKIPIGEAVDEAEDFAQTIYDLLNDNPPLTSDESGIKLASAYSELNQAKKEALEMRDEAALSISAAWNLIDLTSPGTDRFQDCVNDCEDVPCTCDCHCNACGECSCPNGDKPEPEPEPEPDPAPPTPPTPKYIWAGKVSDDNYLCYDANKGSRTFKDSPKECCDKHYDDIIAVTPDPAGLPFKAFDIWIWRYICWDN